MVAIPTVLTIALGAEPGMSEFCGRMPTGVVRVRLVLGRCRRGENCVGSKRGAKRVKGLPPGRGPLCRLAAHVVGLGKCESKVARQTACFEQRQTDSFGL